MTDIINDIRLIERGPYRRDDSTFITSLSEFPHNTRVLHVDYIYTPTERLELWQRQNTDLIKELMILYAGYDTNESGRIDEAEVTSSFEITQTRVSGPDNVQEIGTEITKFLTYTDEVTYSEVIFFDSISVMLQYTSLNTVVRFIQESLAELKHCDAGGRFYFSPAVHDRETISVIESLF